MYLTGVYVMGMHLIGMHLIGVYIIGVHHRYTYLLLLVVLAWSHFSFWRKVTLGPYYLISFSIQKRQRGKIGGGEITV